MSTDNPPASFGGCCSDLHDALTTNRSTFRVEGGVLYLIVGRPPKRGPEFYDRAVFYCPFCGRQLQTPDEVRAKFLP